MYKSIAVHTRSTYWSNREMGEEMVVDADELAHEVTTLCNKLDKEGYDIISIIPISSGNVANGSGYYQTESVLVTAKRAK
jgi:hypothetical protein